MSHAKYDPKTLASTKAEEWTVGALLIDFARMTEIQARLKPEDFYDPTCRIIFAAQLHLWKRNLPCTLPTIVEHFRSTAKLTAAGGVEHIQRLVAAQYDPAFLSHYARIIADTAAVREFAATLRQTAQDAHEVRGYDHASVCEYLIDAQNSFKEIVDKATASLAAMTLTDSLDLARVEADKPEDATPTLKFGLIDMDSLGDLLRPGRLIVVGARPGDGKSTMLLHLCLQAVRSEMAPTLLSLEMPATEIAERVAAHVTDCSRPDGGFAPDVYAGVSQDQAHRRMRIQAVSRCSIDELRVMAKDAHRRGEMDILLVDYLQLISAAKPENRQQEVALVARGLKDVAMDLNIPVVAAAQLNRTVIQNEEPGLSQLRESGNIEASADVAILLWTKDDEPNNMRVRVAKHRGGKAGRGLLQWTRGTYTLRSAAIPSQNLMSASLSSWTV